MNKEQDEAAPDTVRSTPSPVVVDPVSEVTVKRPGRPRGKHKKNLEPMAKGPDAVIVEIERKEGRVESWQVMYLLRSYRSLEATARAQKEVLVKQADELKTLKMRTQ